MTTPGPTGEVLDAISRGSPKGEKLQQHKTQEESIIIQGAVGGLEEPRSIKPLILPPFSGADPVPRDEASCEQ